MKGGDQKQFQCTYPGCDKVFNRRDYLERHATNHLPVKPFVCIQCDRHFSRKDLFDNHLSTKRHARVANEAEHNVVAATASNPDCSMYLSDEFDDPSGMGATEGPIAQDHDTLIQGAASISDLRAHSDISPTTSATSLGPADQNHRYFEYSLPQPSSHDNATAWDLELSNQNRRQSQFLYQQHQQKSRQPSQQSQQHQKQRQHYLNQHQQRLQQDQLKQQDNQRRHHQQHQHKDSQQSLQQNHQSIQQQQPQSWDQEQRLRSFSTAIPSDTPAVGLRSPSGMESPVMLNGLMNWTSTLSLSQPQRRSSVDITSNGSQMSPHNQSVTASDLANLRLPASESEDVTSSVILEQLIADDVANTDREAFAVLRELPSPCVDANTSDNRTSAHSDSGASTPSSDAQADAIFRVDGDSRYVWFFNDSFETENSKYGYDLFYSEAMDAYAVRASASHESDMSLNTNHLKHGGGALSSSNSPVSFTSASSNSDTGSATLAMPKSPNDTSASPTTLNTVSPVRGQASISSIQLHPVRAALLIQLLHDLPPHLQDSAAINSALQLAWKRAEDIGHIVHQPTFDANTAHMALLSVMVLIGLSLSDQREAAHRIYATVYLQAYQSLHQISIGRVTRLDQSVCETLQAFCLLLRYEPLILGSEVDKLSFSKGESGRYVTDRFLWTALSSVPHSNEFSSPFSDSHVQHQPIWSTSCSEAFLFHQGAEPEAQWREWALLEAAKRTVHLATYFDGIRTFIGSSEAPVSLFNLDIHMISSDALWNARTADQFFFIAGPSGALTTVPYLGLIKALIRFPRVAQRPGEQDSEPEKVQGTPWSMFALQALAHGLISIVGRLSGLYAHEEEMLTAAISVRGLLPSFDNRIQARLYRGLDVWVQNFNAAYGPVDQQPFSPAGSGPVPQYAMLIILCHYASFIYVHEDVPIVCQVTAKLKTWLETRGSCKALEMLDYLYMPLYVKWVKTEEAKSIVSTSALYLAWMHAVASQVPGRANYLFLSAMIYISTVAVWLYEFASDDNASSSLANNSQKQGALRLENFQFMDDAIEYLSALHANVVNKGPPPKSQSVHAVIMLSACMLYRRDATSQLVDMLIEILSVMKLGRTKEELFDVVKKSVQVYHDRLMRTMEIRDCPSATSSTIKTALMPTDLESEAESDMHMSDVEMTHQFLSPSVGHAMIA